MKKRGITLIALVVTIIVLLILSAVSITFLLGDEGVIKKAQNSRLESRYAQISDLVKIREASLKISFEKNETGELSKNFVDRLRVEGLVKPEDNYDEPTRTLSLGLQENGEYKYNIYILEGSLLGKEIIDAINELPDADAPGNGAMKNMTLLATIDNLDTVEDRTATIFLNKVEGLSINWDAKNSSNFVDLTEPNPTHEYTATGEYEIQIKGVAPENTVFGINIPISHEESLEYSRKFYEEKNTNISGIKYWGENGFSRINSISRTLKGTIPKPSRNSFVNVKYFMYTFNFYQTQMHMRAPSKKMLAKEYYIGRTSKFLAAGPEITNMITGSIPENFFANCPKLQFAVGVFEKCVQLTGSIPEKLFANCPKLQSVDSVFHGCSGLTGNIPEGLFANCPKLESVSAVFAYCNNLTGSIPQGLFLNSSNLEFAGGLFEGCIGLTGNIPEGLFANCPKIELLNSTFYNCINLTGPAPELWTRPNNPDGYKCFYGCTKLSNYSLIPTSWK